MSMVWLAETLDGGRPVFRIGRDGDQMVAEWAGLATLIVDRAATNPRFQPQRGADPTLVAKLQAGGVHALLRHLRGGLTFHASAVATGGGALALIGDPGAGKSTLAFALAASEMHSFALLSDDCLAVDRDLALPTESIAWLDGAARTALALPSSKGKAPVKPQRVADRPGPLRSIVQLAFADTIRVTQLRGAAAAAVLGRALIRFVLDEPEVHRADMDRLVALFAQVPLVELARPKGLEHLDTTLAKVAELCASW